MKVTFVLAALTALVAAAPAVESTDSTACFVRRADGLFERHANCHYKKSTDACLLKRADGLYERSTQGCGRYD